MTGGERVDYVELLAVWTLKAESERQQHRLNDLQFLLYPNPPLDGTPRTSTRSSPTERIATLLVDIQRNLNELAERIEVAKLNLLDTLESLLTDELPRRVLIYHYVGCQSFNAVAKHFSYSRRQVIRLHNFGLRSLGLDVRTMMRLKKYVTACHPNVTTLSLARHV